MRKLVTHDAFLAFRVLKEVDIKEELIKMVEMTKGMTTEGGDLDKAQREAGAKFIFALLANAGSEKAEASIYAFLEGPMEIPAEELKTMEFFEFANKIMKLLNTINPEEWKAFFSPLLRNLMKLST